MTNFGTQLSLLAAATALFDVNYAPIVVIGFMILLTIWWLTSQRKVFKGPVIQGDESTLEQMEAKIESESIYHEPGVAVPSKR